MTKKEKLKLASLRTRLQKARAEASALKKRVQTLEAQNEKYKAHINVLEEKANVMQEKHFKLRSTVMQVAEEALKSPLVE